MAYLRMDFLSQALKKITTMTVVIPNDVPEEERQGNPYYERGMKTARTFRLCVSSTILRRCARPETTASMWTGR